MERINKRELLPFLRAQFRVDWKGHHGIAHWARVRVNGLLLAQETRANAHVVELFSFFHDARRLNEHRDDGHGFRGFELAQELRDRFFDASDDEMLLLRQACEFHSDGLQTGNPTVLTCWDADRLDLGRVGIQPVPERLCTETARGAKFLQGAHDRAIAWTRIYERRFID
jgi:uncharacterized protein